MNIFSLLVFKNLSRIGIGKCVSVEPLHVSVIKNVIYKMTGYSFYKIGLYSEMHDTVYIKCIAKTSTIDVDDVILFHCKRISDLCIATKIKHKGVSFAA